MNRDINPHPRVEEKVFLTLSPDLMFSSGFSLNANHGPECQKPFLFPKKGPSQLNGINELTDLPLEMMYSTNHQESTKTRTAGTKTGKNGNMGGEDRERCF